MLQVPPPLRDHCPPCSLPWQAGRGLGYGQAVINGVVGGGGGCIRPERSSRANVQKLTWRNSNWVRGYDEHQFSSMTICDLTPTVAMKRIILLYENQQFREAANFINRLHRTTFKSILEDLPVDMFIEAIPESLPILEALYAKVFLSDGLNFPMKILRPENVIMQVANLFSCRETYEGLPPNAPNPIVLSCKKLIKVIILSEPRLKKQMMGRRRALEKAVEGMGQHGLVGTNDKKTLMNLHEALKLEFERVIYQYKIALQKLDELCLTPKQLVTRSLSYGPAPTKASHQRQLSLRQEEIQERLIKNKTLLNVVEPTLTDNSLDLLLKTLRKRVEIDKDIVFQFTQLKKEVKGVDPDAVVAPVLMKFAKGCTKVLEMMKELGDGDDDISSSDISGYHSDSDSAVASGSFQSRGCRRYNLMYRSVRVNSRSSSGCSSADSRSTESARSSRNKQKNGSNKTLQVVNDLKSGTVTIHVPNARCVSTINGSHVSSGGSLTLSGGSHVSSGGSHVSSGGSHGSSAGSRASSELSSSTILCENLQQELETLKKELKVARLTISNLQERESQMKSRLAEQAQKMLERGVRFENVSLGEKRPTALIRKFGNLYAQSRVDTLDSLDELLPLQNSDQLKTKILFSVIVLAFRSVQNTISDIKLNLRSLLQVRDYSLNDPTLKELDNGVAVYLRRTSDTFNLTKNINDVCAQIYATLYDYPCLKECPGLIKYVKECVRIAWGLTNQNPPYVIEYETRVYKRENHLRFHTSNSNSDAIKNYMWPVLLEGENGPCVYKGVVIT